MDTSVLEPTNGQSEGPPRRVDPLAADPTIERGLTRDSELRELIREELRALLGHDDGVKAPAEPEPVAGLVVTTAMPPILPTIVGALGVSNVVTLLGVLLGVIAAGGLWGVWVAMLVLAVVLVGVGYVLHVWETRGEPAAGEPGGPGIS